MIIIGIHNSGTTSTAAAVVDGDVVFGCAEERLNRVKYSKYHPKLAVAACLEHLGISLAEVDAFAIGWNPGINVASRFRAGYSEWPGYPGARLYAVPNQLLPDLGADDFLATEQVFRRPGAERSPRIVHVTHHLAHCANAFYLSGYREAAIFSCDGYGERATTVWAEGTGDGIRVLREIRFPHSIGSFYSALTEQLGFRPDLDEWKVMGAAAYGDPGVYEEAVRKLIHFDEDARFELDLSYFNHFDFDTRGMLTNRARELFGAPRQHQDPLEQRHFDLAAAAQRVLEDYLMTAVRWLARETGRDRLCLGGGVMMNSLFNGKVSGSGLFRDVYISHSPDDSGNSIGAALWLARREGEAGTPAPGPATPFLGRAYSDEAVQEALDRYHLAYSRPADIIEAAADLLAQGKVLGWFQGRMEFGQRALGARSILADPRDPEMKQRINAAVKYRESFRPFAPAVLESAVAEYFETDGSFMVPYMERVLPIRPGKRALIPAVVHNDGTGRLQTVSAALTPAYHRLIEGFGRRTGIPILLNTSFNLNSEPIVESPSDAIRTFHTSGIDALALGGFLLQKP